MRASPFIVAVALAVSGCVGGPEAGPAAPSRFGEDGATANPSSEYSPIDNETLPPAADESGPGILSFTETFTLQLTQARVGSTQANLERNCVNFGKGKVWMVFNGTAEATWSSSTPFGNQLAIEIWDGGGQARLYAGEPSTSPAEIEYGQFRITQASTLGLAFIVQPIENGVIAQMPVQLTITFKYVGHTDLDARAIPCHPTPTQREGDSS